VASTASHSTHLRWRVFTCGALVCAVACVCMCVHDHSICTEYAYLRHTPPRNKKTSSMFHIRSINVSVSPTPRHLYLHPVCMFEAQRHSITKIRVQCSTLGPSIVSVSPTPRHLYLHPVCMFEAQRHSITKIRVQGSTLGLMMCARSPLITFICTLCGWTQATSRTTGVVASILRPARPAFAAADASITLVLLASCSSVPLLPSGAGAAAAAEASGLSRAAPGALCPEFETAMEELVGYLGGNALL
jgi:hypothetical protein